MNILAFDRDGSLGALVRAALRGCGHRVSLDSDPDAARIKLDTALFDALVVGPCGMPEALEDYVEGEWPAMPIVLAGMEGSVAPAGSVVAVLAKPLCVERLAAALRRVEQKEASNARRSFDMPVDVIAGEQRLACRIVRIARGSVMLETEDGVEAAEGPLALRRGKVRVEGDVAFRDRGIIAIRVAPELAAKLEVGDAESRDGSPARRGVPDL